MDSILTNGGRIALAKFLMEKELFLAWGSGDTSWGEPYSINAATNELFNEDGDFETHFNFISNVEIVANVNLENEFTFIKNTDFFVTEQTGVISLPNGSPVLDHEYILVRFIVGVAPADGSRTELFSEVGRRRITNKTYVVPNNAGAIIAQDGRKFSYSTDNAPTPHVYLKTTFLGSDAPTATIREIAVFQDTELAESVPDGQDYVEAEDVTEPGLMVTLETRQAIIRNAAAKETFNLVITT